MAIVINEFEAVAEAPAPRDSARNAADSGHAQAGVDIHEIAAAQHAWAERTLRSWAH